MSSHTQYGFIAILLSILMCFAYLSFYPKEESISVSTEHQGAICFLSSCGRHVIEFQSDHNIKIDEQIVSVQVFLNRLGKGHEGCEERSVFIHADPKIKSGQVVELTNSIKKVLPNVKIGWGDNGN
jgi:biopolymer transport protein ExbD